MAADYDPDFDQQGAVNRLLLVARALALLDLDGLLAVCSVTHAVGPMLDPTAYRDQLDRGDLAAIEQLARDLLPAVRTYRELIEPKLPVVV